jgi:hypothetical protein
MKQYTDEEMQEWLDNGVLPAGATEPPAGEAIARYQQLYNALALESPVGLPADFSLRVLAALPPEESPAAERSFHYWVVAVFVLVVAGVLVWLGFASIETADLLTELLEYKWMALFSLVAILLFQLADWRLLKHRIE